MNTHTTHESEKLNALCGKTVEIIFFDNDSCVGILHKDTVATKYQCENLDSKKVIGYYLTRPFNELHFKKSHIKSIKEM